MYKYLFFQVLFLFILITPVSAQEIMTVKLYSETGSGGSTSDGRIFEDRYSSWETTMDLEKARIADAYSTTYPLRNVLGTGNGPTAYALQRLMYSFDTSIIPDDAVIQDATLSLFGVPTPENSNPEYENIYITEAFPVDPGYIKTTDYSRVGDQSFGVTDGWVSYGRNPVVLNFAGINSIKKDGITTFAIRGTHDFNRTTPTDTSAVSINVTAREAGGEFEDPYLEITYLIEEEEETDVYILIQELIQDIKDSDLKKNVKNSYLANLKKVERFLLEEKIIPAENQLYVFIKKLEHDFSLDDIGEEIFDDYLLRAEQIAELIFDMGNSGVPLITQVVSPHPSITETSSWADEVYAGGRADAPGDCGETIAQCGCLLTSLTMVGRNYGVESGFDNLDVDPKHMNEWLLSVGGYDAVGNILLPFALAYLGEEQDGTYQSHFTLNGHGVTKENTIKNFLKNEGPAIGFNRSKGHWMVLTGKTENGYSINDPFWYNTKTTDDERTDPSTIQDYDNTIDKSTLISYNSELKPLQELIHITLASPAELLITDEKGRRTGFDPETSEFLHEIPGSSYDSSYAILDPVNPSEAPHHTKHLVLSSPEGENFSLEVIGTNNGEYRLTTAISDGGGGLYGEEFVEEISTGEVDGYTLMTSMNEDSLPDYLKDILDLVLVKDQKKFVQAFKVIALQTEKGHVIPTENLIENLVRYIGNHFGTEGWTGEVITKLQALL